MKHLLFLLCLSLFMGACDFISKQNESLVKDMTGNVVNAAKEAQQIEKAYEDSIIAVKKAQHEKDSIAAVEAEQLALINKFYNYYYEGMGSSYHNDQFYPKHMTAKLTKKLKKEYRDTYEGDGMTMWNLFYPCCCDIYNYKYQGVKRTGNNLYVVTIKHPKIPGTCDGISRIQIKVAKEGEEWKLDDYEVLCYGNEKYWPF